MSSSIRMSFKGVLFAALCVSGVALATVNTGRITRVTETDVQVVNPAGIAAKAEQGSLINSTDTVRTGPDGKVKFTMSDSSKFAIPPNSEFKIEEYADRTPSSPARAVYSLLKGAFRTVSGLIGKTKDDTYEMRTPVATMGIRGTDYAAVMKQGGDVKRADGLYATVIAGKIVLQNAAGVLEVAKGQFAYVKNANTPPVLIRKEDAEDVFTAAGLNLDLDFGVELFGTSLKQKLEIDPDLNLRIEPKLPPIKPPRVVPSPS